MSDRLSAERETEIRNWAREHDDLRDDAAANLDWGDARLLLAALDASRAETERLRGLGRVKETLRAIRERDEALREVGRWKSAVGDAGFRHQADNYHAVDLNCLEGLIESHSGLSDETVSLSDTLLDTVAERDEARADAVAIFDASSPDGYPDHGPGNYDEMRERVEGYRDLIAKPDKPKL